MINPQTLPCSFEQLFNVPFPATPVPQKTNLLVDKTGSTISKHEITSTLSTPAVLDADNPDLAAPQGGKGLSIGWWIAIALGAGLVVGILGKELSKKPKNKKADDTPASSN